MIHNRLNVACSPKSVLGADRRVLAHSAIVALCVAGVLISAPAHAASGIRAGVDLDYTHGINERGVSSGEGFAARVGYKLDLLVCSLTPEVGGAYDKFGGAADASLVNGFFGGRLAFGGILQPGVFAHLGYGSLSAGNTSRGGTTVDAGASLDLTVIPVIDIGVHAAYDAALIKNQDAFDWFRIGAHATIAF